MLLVSLIVLWSIAGPLLLAKFEMEDRVLKVSYNASFASASGLIRIFSSGPIGWIVLASIYLKHRRNLG